MPHDGKADLLEREFEKMYATYVKEVNDLKQKLAQQDKSVEDLNRLMKSQNELLQNCENQLDFQVVEIQNLKM